jgi:hypothetical protein
MWIEYKPIAKLTPDRVVDFISDILHRSASRTPSSRTWDQILRQTNFGSSVKMHASKSNMSPLHTQGPMVKSRGRTA